MMGPEFLLKQLGVDPDEIKKRFVEGRDMVSAAALDFRERMQRIESKQDEILSLLKNGNAAQQQPKRLQIVKGKKA